MLLALLFWNHFSSRAVYSQISCLSTSSPISQKDILHSDSRGAPLSPKASFIAGCVNAGPFTLLCRTPSPWLVCDRWLWPEVCPRQWQRLELLPDSPPLTYEIANGLFYIIHTHLPPTPQAEEAPVLLKLGSVPPLPSGPLWSPAPCQ